MASGAAASNYERVVASALAMDARQMWQHYCSVQSLDTIIHAVTTTCPMLSVPKQPVEMCGNETSTAAVLSGNTGQHSGTDDTNTGQHSEIDDTNTGQHSGTDDTNTGQHSEIDDTNTGQHSGTDDTNTGQHSEIDDTVTGQHSGTDDTNTGQHSGTHDTNTGQQSETDVTNMGQHSGTDDTNTGQHSGTDDTNTGQHSGTDDTNTGQHSGTDDTNMGRHSGTDDTNVGQHSGTDDTDTGQHSETDNTNTGQHSGTDDADTGQHSEIDVTSNIADVPAGVRGTTDHYLAESLARELKWGQVSVQVREHETRYIEVLGDRWAKEEERRDGDVVPPTDQIALAKDDVGSTSKGVDIEPTHGTRDRLYVSRGTPRQSGSEHSLGTAEVDTDTNRPESETDTDRPESETYAAETDTIRPESETDTDRPESETDTNRPESETHVAETDTIRPESETNTDRPEPETDTDRPESETHVAETDTIRPESETHAAETDTNRPESETHAAETDTNKPDSETHAAETDTNKPESETHAAKTDTYRLESETDTNRPESETETNRPESETHTIETDTYRLESETDTYRPGSETDTDGTDAGIDHVTSENEIILTSKSASVCSTTMQAVSETSTQRVRSTVEVATNTVAVNLQTVATNTAAPSVVEAQCNTDLSCSELLENIYGTKKWHKLQEDYRNAMSQLNEERSQKMVAEQLLNIVQSDFSDLRQKTIGETTSRLRLENELGDIKGELSHAQRQVEERDRRITELEESLTGTSLLVRKLEEQNSVSLMSRGGIDYMLEAKLAEGRAQEAEQKVLVLQTELLQSQNEVRRLLDRVAEATREKTEMVSSKVHTQLLEIADEKAMAAERRALELDKEVHDLKRKLSEMNGTEKSTKREHEFAPFSLTTSTYGYPSSSYPLPSSYPTLSSSFSPFTYTSEHKLPTLEAFKPSLFGSYTNGDVHTTSQPSLSILEKPSSSLYSQKGHGVSLDDHVSKTSVAKEPSRLVAKEDSKKGHSVSLDDHVSKTSVAKEPSRLSSVGSKGLSAVDLPSFDTTPELDQLLQPAPATLNTADSDSSNWSSSDDETGVPANPLRPSAHARLTAQWEWRAMQDGTTENQTPVQTVVTSPTKKKPPLTPKPKLFQQSSAHKPPPTAPKPSHWTGSHEVTHESPSSFDDPKKEATLLSLTRTRPRGPNGRNVPSRYMYHWSHGTPS